MKVISLQSGSNGNCIYVESDAGRRLLLDAGISGIQARTRLEAHGIDIHTVEGVIISHDHSDHVRCAGIYQRKFGLPVYMTAATQKMAGSYCRLGVMGDVRHFVSGETLEFGDLSVTTIRTPHDAADGVVFVLTCGSRRLGVMTDLGHVFDGLEDVLASLDAVLLESNYDPQMLADGPYPPPLKQRIAGPRGHLSNAQSAHLLDKVANGRLKWACLGHLSEVNNEPRLALATHRSIIRHSLPLLIASRYKPSDEMVV